MMCDTTSADSRHCSVRRFPVLFNFSACPSAPLSLLTLLHYIKPTTRAQKAIVDDKWLKMYTEKGSHSKVFKINR